MASKERKPKTDAPDDLGGLADLLEYLRLTRGFDFTAYKRTSLVRRLRRRMESVAIDGFAEYKDYLEVHPEEFGMLFNSFLINVTSFFRDPGAWDYLRDQVLPGLLAGTAPGQPLRVWSAGCSSGEEPYTLAIVLAEALGQDEFRRRVKIYATDVDDDALTSARHAIYSEERLRDVEPTLRARYFEGSGPSYTFRKDMRRSIIFGRHDLIQDAPISHVDLLVCRNTLMYFNMETQSRVLARFHFALNETGFLFLGKVEMLLTRTSSFTSLELAHRVFRKVPLGTLRDRALLLTPAGSVDATTESARQLRARELAFETAPVHQLVVDSKGVLLMINEAARRMFRLGPPDVGRLLQDLTISYRPVELRSLIDASLSERKAVVLNDVEVRAGEDDRRWLDVHVQPLLDSVQVVGVMVSFVDVSRAHEIQGALFRADRALETTQEELQSTNEELETTNEELQSTVEELETTNEELHSSNEELETMNEELQSTNDELRLINDQLQLRTTEANHVNGFLQNVLGSLRAAVVVLDKNLRVQTWNPHAEELWGVRPEEALGELFTGLDIGLPVGQLKKPLRACIDDALEGQEFTFTATNRRGKVINCLVALSPLRDADGKLQGALVFMEELRER